MIKESKQESSVEPSQKRRETTEIPQFPGRIGLTRTLSGSGFNALQPVLTPIRDGLLSYDRSYSEERNPVY